MSKEIIASNVTRVSFRIFVKGGGANATIGELRGGDKDYSNNSSV